MKWKINKKGHIEDEKGTLICTLPENSTPYNAALIKYAPEMIVAITDFCGSNETTTSPRNPKWHYDRFQRILERIMEESE